LEENGDEDGRLILFDKSLKQDQRKKENKEWDCLISKKEIDFIKNSMLEDI